MEKMLGDIVILLIIVFISFVWSRLMKYSITLTSPSFTDLTNLKLYLLSLPSFAFFIWISFYKLMIEHTRIIHIYNAYLLLVFITAMSIVFGLIIKDNTMKPIGFLKGFKISFLLFIFSIPLFFGILIITIMIAGL